MFSLKTIVNNHNLSFGITYYKNTDDVNNQNIQTINEQTNKQVKSLTTFLTGEDAACLKWLYGLRRYQTITT